MDVPSRKVARGGKFTRGILETISNLTAQFAYDVQDIAHASIFLDNRENVARTVSKHQSENFG